jgi:hypothetical protein
MIKANIWDRKVFQTVYPTGSPFLFATNMMEAIEPVTSRVKYFYFETKLREPTQSQAA